MSVKTFWLLMGAWFLLLVTGHAQTISGGAGFTGGFSLNGIQSGSVAGFWNPTLTLTNLQYNNTSNCFATGENCAPQVGTTGNQSTFPGMQETRFTGISASFASGTVTLSVPASQGCCSAGNTNGVYNFSTSDSVTVQSLGSPWNGTFSVTSLTSGSPGKLKYALSSASGTPSGGVIFRVNQSSQDRYIPAPANVANYVNDGVDIHNNVWPGYNGYVFIHVVPFQHCPTPTSSACTYAAKPNQTTNGSHVMVGYESDNANEVLAQYNAMLRLEAPGGKMGIVFDWGGGPVQGMSSTRTKEDAVADLWAAQLSGNANNFKFTMAHDNSGWGTSAVANACGLSGSSAVNQSPSCVEQFLEASLQYEHTATTSTYVSVLDGQTYNGGGYFANSAYLRDPNTGQPLNFSFINGESSFFTSCTSGSPCATYNAGSPGTCTSSSDCWSKLKAGIASFISTWGSDKPEFLWRNSFTNNTSINAGDMQWWNQSSTASNEVFDTTTIANGGAGGSQSSKILIPFVGAHLNHAQSSFQDDSYIIGGRCGQTYVDWFSKIYTYNGGASWGPTVKTPIGVQIGTWNDHEEGTAVEPGIPICYSINASISGSVISWSLTTSDTTYAPLSPLNGTIDHIALLAVKSGGAIGSLDTQVIATAAPASSGTFNLSLLNMDQGGYSLYIKLVPKALMQTKITASLPYTR